MKCSAEYRYRIGLLLYRWNTSYKKRQYTKIHVERLTLSTFVLVDWYSSIGIIVCCLTRCFSRSRPHCWTSSITCKNNYYSVVIFNIDLHDNCKYSRFHVRRSFVYCCRPILLYLFIVCSNYGYSSCSFSSC